MANPIVTITMDNGDVMKAELYPEFTNMVKKLHESGYLIGVATLKAEKFANIMLQEMKIRNYFNMVCGMDEHDDLDHTVDPLS